MEGALAELEHALDVAADYARDYLELEDAAAIERVRVFVRELFAGEPARVHVEDLARAMSMLSSAAAPEGEHDDL